MNDEYDMIKEPGCDMPPDQSCSCERPVKRKAPVMNNDRPDIDTVLMQTAGAFEPRSTCDRNHVGAVIAINGRIVSTGYNGAPAGMPHCNHGLKPQGVHPRVSPVPLLPSAPLDRGCKLAIHAEANAIAYAARNGTALMDSTVYTTLSPCYACSQLMIAAGVVRVVYDRSYRDPAGIDLLRSAGLTVNKV